eukprot:gene14576-20621_t
MPPERFSVTNILGKAPQDPKLEDLYTIGKQLGRGAFGVVKLATRKGTGEQLAVKSIAKSKLVCREDVKDVQAEVAIMNLVAGHQNVVTLMVRMMLLRLLNDILMNALAMVLMLPRMHGLSAPLHRAADFDGEPNCWSPICAAAAFQPPLTHEDKDQVLMVMELCAGGELFDSMSTHEDKDQVHMVMELCAGGELFDSIVEAGCFTERKAAQVFRKMVEVVNHCHELGVVHRDLKPENFLLTSKGADSELKLTDFGLGAFFKPGERFRDLVGSPYYVAPEVLRKNYSSEADMWSLGVILYILLSGLPPFWGDNEEQIFKMVLKGVIDFKTDPWPKLSQEAKDCVTSLLTQDPTKRATAADTLQHKWLAVEGMKNDHALDSVVLTRLANFSQMNKLKKMCMMVVGQNLTPDEIAGLKQLFKTIDADGNGTITVSEMRTLFKTINADGNGTITVSEMRTEELNNLMAVADVDGDGKIDYNEFVAATMHMSQDELLLKAFKQLDTDNSGTIEIKELEVALAQFGFQVDTDEGMKQAELQPE